MTDTQRIELKFHILQEYIKFYVAWRVHQEQGHEWFSYRIGKLQMKEIQLYSEFMPGIKTRTIVMSYDEFYMWLEMAYEH